MTPNTVNIEEVARRLDAKSAKCLRTADELQAELTAKGIEEPVLHPSVILQLSGADAYRVAAEMCRGAFTAAPTSEPDFMKLELPVISNLGETLANADKLKSLACFEGREITVAKSIAIAALITGGYTKEGLTLYLGE